MKYKFGEIAAPHFAITKGVNVSGAISRSRSTVIEICGDPGIKFMSIQQVEFPEMTLLKNLLIVI